MSDQSSTHKLKDIFPIAISGEWGSEPVGKGNALVLRAADFTKDCKLRLNIGAARIIPANKLGSRVLKDGDILIEMSGGSPDQPVGRVAYFDREIEGKIYTHSNFLQLLRVSDEFDPKFSYYLMVFLYNSGLVYRYQQQTTGIINLKLEQYLQEKFEVPHFIIQKKIQLILSTIDQAIEKTEALIEKYQQIKAGLMHDLFTRGITADGKLRPPREQAPELYQETPIGWIPKDWECMPFDTCIEMLTDYHANGAYEILKQHVELFDHKNFAIMIRTTNFEQNDFSDSLKYISESAYYFLSKSVVLESDILMNKIANPGVSYLMPELKMPVSLGMNLFLIRLKKEYCPVFLQQYLRLNKEYVKSFSSGTGTKTITKDAVRSLLVTIPKSSDEVNRISSSVEVMKKQIDTEVRTWRKLKKQKQGLMQDLLTGKVPVKVDNEAVHA